MRQNDQKAPCSVGQKWEDWVTFDRLGERPWGPKTIIQLQEIYLECVVTILRVLINPGKCPHRLVTNLANTCISNVINVDV